MNRKYFLNRRSFIFTIIAIIAKLVSPSKIVNAQSKFVEALTFKLDLSLQSSVKVFAHWHFFPISFDNKISNGDYYSLNYLNPDGENGKYKESGGFFRDRPIPRDPIRDENWEMYDLVYDISLASKINIDGFHYNISEFSESSKSWDRYIKLLKACLLSGKKFYVIPCIDCAALSPIDLNGFSAVMLSNTLSDPSIFKNAKQQTVVSFFLPELIDIQILMAFIDRLRSLHAKISIYFIFLSWEPTSNFLLLASLADMCSIWGADNIDGLDSMSSTSKYFKDMGKTWVTTIWPQDFRPASLSFVESRNSELFRKSWMIAIDNEEQYVNLATWNDYSEGSEIRPSKAIKHAYYDLAGYYIFWLKNKHPPIIQKESLYYFHRVQIIDLTKIVKQRRPFKIAYGPHPTNNIEVITFINAPATLEIRIGDNITTFEAGIGMNVFNVQSACGTPIFTIKRNQKIIMEITSSYEIKKEADYQDLLYHGDSS